MWFYINLWNLFVCNNLMMNVLIHTVSIHTTYFLICIYIVYFLHIFNMSLHQYLIETWLHFCAVLPVNNIKEPPPPHNFLPILYVYYSHIVVILSYNAHTHENRLHIFQFVQCDLTHFIMFYIRWHFWELPFCHYTEEKNSPYSELKFPMQGKLF